MAVIINISIGRTERSGYDFHTLTAGFILIHLLCVPYLWLDV